MPAYPYFTGVTPATATTLPTVVISGVTASYVPPDVWNQVMRQFEYIEVDVNHQNHNVAGVNVLTAVTANITTLNLGGALTSGTTGAFSGALSAGSLSVSGAATALSLTLSGSGKRLSLGADVANIKLAVFDSGSDFYGFGVQSA